MAHPSANKSCGAFFRTYTRFFKEQESVKVVEIGSCSVNGSLRSYVSGEWEYIGVDIEQGPNVDLVLDPDDLYKFPMEDSSVDIVFTSSCLEHVECPWLTVLESIRILKPRGLLYINAPSAGHYHGYPSDCWRHFPDAGKAYKTWCNRNGYNVELLESFVLDSTRGADAWEDFVMVMLKDRNEIDYFGDAQYNRMFRDDDMKDMYLNFRTGVE